MNIQAGSWDVIWGLWDWQFIGGVVEDVRQEMEQI
jgi:hypothetical protein